MWDPSTCPYLVTTIKTRSQYISLKPLQMILGDVPFLTQSLMMSLRNIFFFFLVSA